MNYMLECVCTYGLHDCSCVYVNSWFVHELFGVYMFHPVMICVFLHVLTWFVCVCLNLCVLCCQCMCVDDLQVCIEPKAVGLC